MGWSQMYHLSRATVNQLSVPNSQPCPFCGHHQTLGSLCFSDGRFLTAPPSGGGHLGSVLSVPFLPQSSVSLECSLKGIPLWVFVVLSGTLTF